MNIIVFTRQRGQARQINLRYPPMAASVVAAVTLVLASAFYTGYQFGGPRAQDPAKEIEAVRAVLARQGQEVAGMQRSVQERTDALAVRMGQMNSHVIRLDALGRRLTQMAGLESGEFDFEARPAQGGPEPESPGEPMQLGDLEQSLDLMALQIENREQQLDILENLLMNRNLSNQVHPQGRPVTSGWISSYFGRRTDPFTGRAAWHKGIDFAGRPGAEVVAVGAGVVTWSRERYGYGRMVEINHGNGYVTRYAHNEVNLVAVGDKVERGQSIALMGSTGRATGPHLHFEVLYSGKVVNPLSYTRDSQ